MKSLSARRAWIEIERAIRTFKLAKVALRKESVDRNQYRNALGKVIVRSLSARRAWIEMAHFFAPNPHQNVALRKESVDRNWQATANITQGKVALRKESVDRNCAHALPSSSRCCRSPQGERG